MKKLSNSMRIIVLKVASIVFVISMLIPTTACGEKKFVVGTKDYTEQVILGHMYAELIRAHTDYRVSIKSDLSSNIVFSAIKRGDVSMYVDYTGTLYSGYLGYDENKPPKEVFEIVKTELMQKHKLQVYDSIGFNNTYALAVKKSIAAEYNLETYSDLAQVADKLTIGATMEFLNRQDGMIGLKKEYGISKFSGEIALEGALRYTALERNQVQVIDAFSTDALIKKYDLHVLTDDRDFFPPYWAVPIIRPDALAKFPQVQEVIEAFCGTLNEEIMRGLNYLVDVEYKSPKNVAISYLKENKLI